MEYGFFLGILVIRVVSWSKEIIFCIKLAFFPKFAIFCFRNSVIIWIKTYFEIPSPDISYMRLLSNPQLPYNIEEKKLTLFTGRSIYVNR